MDRKEVEMSETGLRLMDFASAVTRKRRLGL